MTLRDIFPSLAAILLTAAAACTAEADSILLPPANARFDYQLGGAYPPAGGVGIVVRDRLAPPAPGVYNICYVNAFQTQPAEAAWWLGAHPGLLVQRRGAPVIDPDWPDEYLLDTSTPAKRAALMEIVGPWIDRCAQDGFAAIEPDNLDSWTRSQGVLSAEDNTAFAALLAARAHAAGLAIAQKNASELAPLGAGIGFDFAVAEECHIWDECEAYRAVFGDRVFEVEYDDLREDAEGNPVDPARVFEDACAARGDSISVIYRDRAVVPAGAPGYLYKAC